jgi:hypothetical protein
MASPMNLLDNVAGEPGTVLLLEYASRRYGTGQGNALTFGGYAGIGGVRGALGQHAESVNGDLSPAEQAIARRLLTIDRAR